MSVNYFVKARKMYDLIERYLECIISEYDDLIQLSNNNNADISELIFCLNNYNKKKQEILLLKEQIHNILMNSCDHNFETHTVDFGLDSSCSIEYCLKCECHK